MSNESKPILVDQTRKGVFNEDGTVLYAIITEAKLNSSYTGDSRDARFLVNLFVNNIVDSDTPSNDTFSNYATIADLDLIAPDRESALARGSNKYRSNVNRITFDNLSVATTAASVVRDTINNLVDTYLRVKNSFVGSDSHYFPYPEEVSSLRDQYIQQYQSARDVRISAEDSQDVAQTAYELAQAIKDIRAECESKLCSLAQKLTGMSTLVQTIGNRYVATLSHIIDTAADNSDALSGQTAQTVLGNLKAYLEDDFVRLGLVYDSEATSNIDSSVTGSGLSLLANLAQLSIAASQDCNTAQVQLAAATSDLASKLSDLNEKQRTKEAASQAEEAALAQLTLYCPNLDPSSV